MGTLVIEREINAPVQRVYERMIDLDNWANTIEGITKIEKLTEGPVRDGTEFNETRVMFGKEHTETMAFANITPNQGYTLVCDSCGVRYASSHTLTPKGDTTLLRMEMTTTPTKLSAKVLAPIMGAMMKGTMKKMIAKDFDDIARACEANG